MSDANTLIVVEQALHGYEHGHRLLQSSVSFDSSDERSLLIMSDLSGPRLVEGFSEYISGYALPSSKHYAIAKTWYASEMERPGCVWTHTLLFKSEDLAKITNALPVLKSFVRPQLGKNSDYGHDYSLKNTAFYQATPPHNGEPVLEKADILANLIHQLYSQNQFPASLAAESGTQFETLALLIWSQQWPQLRLNFGFCTGSLSERILNSRSLDLQFGPSRIIRNFAVRDAVTEAAPWSVKLSWDLLSREGFREENPHLGLRKFLWDAGSDLRDRTDVSKLVDIYEQLEDATSTLEHIQRAYPDRGMARRLKMLVTSHTDKFSEEEILTALLELPRSDGFDPQELGIRKRAEEYWMRNREAALDQAERVLRLPSNSIRDHFIAGLTTKFTAADFEIVAQSDSDVMLHIAKVRPDVAYRDEFWAADFSVEDKVEVFHFLSGKRNWEPGPALESLLRTRNDQVAAFLASELQEEQIETVLNWAAQSSEIGPLLRPEWLRFFHEHQGAVVKWYADRKGFRGYMAILLAQVVDPLSSAEQLTLETVRAVCGSSQTILQQRPEVAAFIYVSASRYTDASAAELAVLVFPTLHHALAESRLSHPAWQVLAAVLPNLETGDWWDNCEKLRRSLVSFFDARKWPVGILWELLRKDEHLFSDMLKTAKQFSTARGVLRRVFQEIELGNLSASSRQVKEIRKVIK